MWIIITKSLLETDGEKKWTIVGCNSRVTGLENCGITGMFDNVGIYAQSYFAFKKMAEVRIKFSINIK